MLDLDISLPQVHYFARLGFEALAVPVAPK